MGNPVTAALILVVAIGAFYLLVRSPQPPMWVRIILVVVLALAALLWLKS